jgi:hypothetical protein
MVHIVGHRRANHSRARARFLRQAQVWRLAAIEREAFQHPSLDRAHDPPCPEGVAALAMKPRVHEFVDSQEEI